MVRIYSLGCWCFSCLAIALGMVAILAVPTGAFADSGLGQPCTCAPGDGACLGNCCVTQCAGDQACQDQCCQTACGSDSSCLNACKAAKFIKCSDGTPSCIYPTEGECEPGFNNNCNAEPKCNCRWRPVMGTYKCVCIQTVL